jgi:hypothetical protein
LGCHEIRFYTQRVPVEFPLVSTPVDALFGIFAPLGSVADGTGELEIVDGHDGERTARVDDHVRHQCSFQFVTTTPLTKGLDFFRG